MLISIILILCLIVGFLLFKLMKKVPSEEIKLKDADKSTIIVKEKYMYRQEVKMLRILNEILSANYITLPKVSLGALLLPYGSKVVYNRLSNMVVDFVVFEEATMKPLLIVDIFDNSFNDESLLEQEPILTEILESIKLPCCSYQLKGEVNKEELKNLIYKELNLDEKAKQVDTNN